MDLENAVSVCFKIASQIKFLFLSDMEERKRDPFATQDRYTRFKTLDRIILCCVRSKDRICSHDIGLTVFGDSTEL